ncbi:hypothetical protein SAMN04487944_101375 [Gracilibacillus ureilyticus]|uniref:Sporulation and spore germination n=1 Tax=Gracilibacillus ureilyticus TaxID=531814 RepID=A0A1H9LRY1_9BACI|nr:hypothetical protein [Gracilibacillus ureilyticus]SER14160.1 hypothetical protein SAMN04487944_101375 [Gracilibacillus ureilyticus]
MAANHPDTKNKVEKMLVELPSIKDKRDKEYIYQKVQTEVNEPLLKQKNRKLWVFPTLAAAGCLLLLLIIVNGIDDFPFSSSSDMESRQESATSESSETEIQDSQLMKESSLEDKGTEENVAENSTIFAPPEDDRSLFHYIDQDNFVYRLDTEMELDEVVFTSWATEDAQYTVPISFRDTDELDNDLKTIYNNASNYISLSENGFSALGFDTFEFFIREEEQQAEIEMNSIESDLSSSANYQMFRYMLEDILAPLRIEQVTLTGNHPFTKQDNHFSPDYRTNTFYKIYQYKEGSPFWLVPVSNSEVESFIGALEEMKKDEEAFHVRGVIPGDAEIDVVNEENVITVSIHSPLIGNNQGTVTMIEAIMFTAKSFGFKQVHFDINIEQAGMYQLNQPLEVPDIINPVY